MFWQWCTSEEQFIGESCTAVSIKTLGKIVRNFVGDNPHPVTTPWIVCGRISSCFSLVPLDNLSTKWFISTWHRSHLLGFSAIIPRTGRFCSRRCGSKVSRKCLLHKSKIDFPWPTGRAWWRKHAVACVFCSLVGFCRVPRPFGRSLCVN